MRAYISPELEEFMKLRSNREKFGEALAKTNGGDVIDMSNQADEKTLGEVARDAYFKSSDYSSWDNVVKAVIAEFLRRNEGKVVAWMNPDDGYISACKSAGDVPLFLAPQPASQTKWEDDALESAIESSDGFFVDGEFRIDGPSLMRLLRYVSQPVEVNLPDRSQLARIITQSESPVDAAQAILELLKEKNNVR